MNLPTTYLREFFALCDDGIVHISTHMRSGSVPIVRYIYDKNGNPISSGRELQGGSSVAITSLWIGLYFPEATSAHHITILGTPEESPERDFGTKTGKCLALFLKLEEALGELAKPADEVSEFERGEFTLETLKAIGQHHPIFVVARKNSENYHLAFPHDFYEEIDFDRNSFPTIPRDIFEGIFPPRWRMMEKTPTGDEALLRKKEIVKRVSPKKITKQKIKKSSVVKEKKSTKKKATSSILASPPRDKVHVIVPPESLKSILPSDEEKVIPAERIFFCFKSSRYMKEMVNGQETSITIEAGEYEMQEISDPTGGENPWLVIRNLFPKRIVGNSKRAFSQWIGVEDASLGITLRTEPIQTAT